MILNVQLTSKPEIQFENQILHRNYLRSSVFGLQTSDFYLRTSCLKKNLPLKLLKYQLFYGFWEFLHEKEYTF